MYCRKSDDDFDGYKNYKRLVCVVKLHKQCLIFQRRFVNNVKLDAKRNKKLDKRAVLAYNV